VDTNILCQLISDRIDPEKFLFIGSNLKWSKIEYDNHTNNVIVNDIIDDYENLSTALTAEKTLEKNRILEIETEQKTLGLRKITVKIAHDKIDAIFDDKTTVTQLRTAIIKAFKLVVVYILK